MVKVPLKERPLVAVLFALVMVMPAAAPGCETAKAVAAVPLVPLTVRPTTLLAVGVIVFSAVLAGTCLMKEPDAGASWTVPLAAGKVMVLAPDGAVKFRVVVLPPVPTIQLELLPPWRAKVPVPLPMLVAAVLVVLIVVVPRRLMVPALWREMFPALALPIATAPVEVPVLMFVLLLAEALMLVTPWRLILVVAVRPMVLPLWREIAPAALLPMVTVPVEVPVLIDVLKLLLLLMLAAAPDTVRPPVPWMRPVPELTPTPVMAPAAVTVKASPVPAVRVPAKSALPALVTVKLVALI